MGDRVIMNVERLCTACSGLNFDKALCSPEFGGASHHPDLATIVVSAEAGCSLCSGILEKQRERYGSDTRPGRVFCNV